MTLVPASSVRGGFPLGLAGATEATRYVGATTSGAPASGTFAVGDFAIDQSGSVYVCTTAGSPGTWTAIGGGAAGADGWVSDSAATWTRTAATTFTVTGDRTAVFQKGTRLKLTQTTVKYFVVVASSHAGGTTTVTVTAGNDYTLAAAAITAPFYSYAASPQGYPSYFTWTPVYTGFSADPAAASARFAIVGNVCTFWHDYNAGTSNATGFTLTVPVAHVIGANVYTAARIENNSVHVVTPGMVEVGFSSSLITLYTAWGGAAWTAANLKAAAFVISYII